MTVTSDRVLPLETTVTPLVATVGFGRTVEAAFAERERIAATSKGEVVTILAIWEPDLEVAERVLKDAYAGEVRWSKPTIVYQYEPRVLEPFLHLEVEMPAETVGNVIGDLCSRRGLILGQAETAEGLVVTAEVPLGELLGYPQALPKITLGRGRATATFARYAPPPPWFDPDEPAAMALRA